MEKQIGQYLENIGRGVSGKDAVVTNMDAGPVLISSLKEVLNQTENEVFAEAIQAALAEME